MTLLNAGLGPAYKGSPYERFGGNENVSFNLASTSLVSALAFRLDERNVVGASLNLGYQEFSVKGLEFLAYKLGVSYQATPALRAGYIYANRVANSSETLFGVLGCLTATYQYTVGATWVRDRWELSGMAAHMPQKSARGQNSIPEAFGGGEIDISDELIAVGLSLGRRF